MGKFITGNVFRFQIKRVLGRWIDKACRIALAEVNPAGVLATTEKGIIKAQYSLVEARRDRMSELAESHWQAMYNLQKWPYIYNCPPIGVATNYPGLRLCNKVTVCPFCWCRRYVWRAWEQLFKFYCSEYSERPKPNHLLEIVRTTRYDLECMSVDAILLTEIAPNRRNLVLDVAPEGAFQLFVLFPPDPKDKYPYWTVETRLLAVMPERGYDLMDLSENITVRHHLTVSRSGLVGAVGRTCEYPLQMFEGPPGPVADLANFFDGYDRLDADKKSLTDRGGSEIKGFRMSSTYGVLRNK